MGYAIIKDINNSKGYALNRLIQNLVPADSSAWVYMPNNVTFSYNTTDVTDGIYRLASIDMKGSTQPYEFEFVGSVSNATIDPISGVITVLEDFTGSSVDVRIKAIYNLYDNCYPTKVGYMNVVSATVTVPVSAPSLAPERPDTYSDPQLTVSYGDYSSSNNIPASGTSVSPTIVLKAKVNGASSYTTLSNTMLENLTITTSSTGASITNDNKLNVLVNNADSTRPIEVSYSAVFNATTLSGTLSYTQDAKALDSIAFNKYDGASSITINSGDTLYANKVSVNAYYNTASTAVIVSAGDNSGITIATSENGTYGTEISNVTANGTLWIKYGGKTTNKAYTVNAVPGVLSVVSNLDGYGLVGSTLSTDDFTVTDYNDQPVTSFTITPSTLSTAGTQTIQISDGNGNTGSINLQVLELSDFEINTYALGVNASTGTVDHVTKFAGPSNSSTIPYEESSTKHLGVELTNTAQSNEKYLVYIAANDNDLPTSNCRLMVGNGPVLDFTHTKTYNNTTSYDPYLGINKDTSSATASAPPANYVDQVTSIGPNKLILYSIPQVANAENLTLTAFIHYSTTTAATLEVLVYAHKLA